MIARALGFAAMLAIIAGCVSSQTAARSTASLPNVVRSATSGDLLYVSEQYYEVLVFEYKDGVVGQQVQTLENFRYPRGMCTDKFGDVWITDQYQGRVLEYQHGGTEPIETVVSQDWANDCAIDPLTGNLAVSSFHGAHGSINIFAPRSHKPTKYKFTYFEPTSLAYDSRGDLVATGLQQGALWELPRGASAFEQLSVSGGSFDQPNGIQWLNPNFLIGSYASGGDVAYKVSIANGVATIVARYSLTDARTLTSIAVRADNAVVPDLGVNVVRTYSLVNGKLISSFTNGLDRPWGVAISQPAKN